MNENWYAPLEQKSESAWYTPAALTAEKTEKADKKRRWRRVISVSLTVGVIAAAAVFALVLDRGRSAASDTPEAPPPEEKKSEEAAKDSYPRDYRDFMKQYYAVSSYKAADACTIPRFTAPEGTELALAGASKEALTRQELYARCADSVVCIRAYENAKADSYGWGSGVIFSSDGYIITNSHIVEGCEKAVVILWNDEEYEAALVGNDARTDIAVLKIEADGLPAAEFSPQGCTVGDDVVAIGNPLGETFRSTMSEGIISGIDRNMSYNGATLPMLQTTAPINSGNSGGALFNMAGQVVGITNMKMVSSYYGGATVEGVCFAIPTATAKSSADSILASGVVTGRPALGITMGSIPASVQEYYSLPDGLYVSAIAHGSDFENKGIELGDIVIAMNGEETHVTTDVTSRLGEVGDEVELTVLHRSKNGTDRTFTVTGVLVDVNDVY